MSAGEDRMLLLLKKVKNQVPNELVFSKFIKEKKTDKMDNDTFYLV